MMLASKIQIECDTPYDVWKIRKDFPILEQKIHGKPLVYLDNAASTQKPRSVIEAITTFMSKDYSNVHRGLHSLSQRATHAFEKARKTVQGFIRARNEHEIVFVRGVTEGINLLAQTFGKQRVKQGDEILISSMEHHSNIVPWQLLCEEMGARLRVIPMNDTGELILEEYERLLTPRVRLVSLVHISNALGTVNPVEQMIRMAHLQGIPVLLDGAQSAPHMNVDVQKLDCDFYLFSGHKVYGPTGIGILYGKYDLLKEMPPYHGGGEMIRSVTFEKSLFKDPPARFEAGTPDIIGAVGLGAALDYVDQIGRGSIEKYERELLEYGTQKLESIPEVRLIGKAKKKAGVLSFVVNGIHPHDVSEVLDHEGVAVRAGHHCAQPVMARLNVPATARASIGLYNTFEDMDVLYKGIKQVIEVFK